MNTAPARIPVTLLTGFLGAGKTTLLNRLLKHPETADTAVLINEFGEIGLDHLLVERLDEDTILLNAGCLCCTIRGDLVRVLGDLAVSTRTGHPLRRVIIETTGLADPAPILQTLMAEPTLLRDFVLDGVVTLVDAVNGAATLDAQPEAVRQVAVADRIFLSKTDIAEDEATLRLRQRLRSLNPGAALRDVVAGDVAPATVLATGPYDPSARPEAVLAWLNAAGFAAGHDHHGHHHGHHDHHQHAHDPNRHDARIHAFCLTFDTPLELRPLATWFEMITASHLANLSPSRRGTLMALGASALNLGVAVSAGLAGSLYTTGPLWVAGQAVVLLGLAILGLRPLPSVAEPGPVGPGAKTAAAPEASRRTDDRARAG